MGAVPQSISDLPRHFVAIHRRCAAELYAPHPSERLASELTQERWRAFAAKLRCAKEGVEDPAQLGGLYERLLEISSAPDRGRRKASGSYYTPGTLAKATVARCIDPLLRDRHGRADRPEEILALRICDPAMGSAAFLLAILERLAPELSKAYELTGHTVPRVLSPRDRLAMPLWRRPRSTGRAVGRTAVVVRRR